MKAIVAGGRDYKLNEVEIEWLINLIKRLNITEIVSGGATGVDEMAIEIAKKLNIPFKIFKPNWKLYGRAAGPKRNEEMAKYSNVAILFKGNKGTLSMKNLAKRYDLKIYDYETEK